MNALIGLFVVTGFIVWVLLFAWLVGFIAEKLGVNYD